MNLSVRIKTIGDFVEPNEYVADIGADHGILELYLLAKYDNVRIVAIENKRGPYSILNNSLRAFKNIRLSFSDGFTAVDRKVKTVVIAGMGGLNIKNILDAYPDRVVKIKKFIIDAHRDIEIARRSIVNYGFKIVKEKIVFEENKFYVINVYEKSGTKPQYSKDELDFGYKIYEDELWPKYKEFLIDKNNQTIAKIKDNEKMQDKVLKLQKINERLQKYGKN